jgi:hypothetical protein
MRGVARSRVEEEHSEEKPMTLLFSKNSNLFSFFQRLSNKDHWNLQVFWALVKEACIPTRLMITRMSVLLSTQWSHSYFDQSRISYLSVHMRKLLKPSQALLCIPI